MKHGNVAFFSMYPGFDPRSIRFEVDRGCGAVLIEGYP